MTAMIASGIGKIRFKNKNWPTLRVLDLDDVCLVHPKLASMFEISG